MRRPQAFHSVASPGFGTHQVPTNVCRLNKFIIINFGKVVVEEVEKERVFGSW